MASDSVIADWAGFLQFREAFAGVLDERLYTMEWLERRLLNGTAQFWRTGNAAIITELKVYPTGAKDIHGLIAAGDIGDIIGTLIPAAEQWGRENGCVGGVIESRPGWARALKAYGYEVYQVAVRKEL